MFGVNKGARMESIVWFIILFGVGYIYYVKNRENIAKNKRENLKRLYGNPKNDEQPHSNYSNIDIDTEAKKIAEGIKTHRGLEGLQNKIDAAQDKLDDYHHNDNETMYGKTEKRMEVLERALEYAVENPYRYYYDELLDVTTPLAEFKLMGKTISVQKFNEFEPGTRDKYDVINLSDADDLDEANEYAKDSISIDEDELKVLIKFRTIVESDMSEEERQKKLEVLFGGSEYLVDELDLDPDENISLYEQYRQNEIMTEKLRKLYPFPYGDYFIEEGIEDMETIKALTDKEILAINGIGEIRAKEIRNYLDRLK